MALFKHLVEQPTETTDNLAAPSESKCVACGGPMTVGEDTAGMACTGCYFKPPVVDEWSMFKKVKQRGGE